jgi:hypothetical protein
MKEMPSNGKPFSIPFDLLFLHHLSMIMIVLMYIYFYDDRNINLTVTVSIVRMKIE